MSENSSKKKNNNRTHVPAEGFTIDDLRSKPLDELVVIADDLKVEHPNELKRQDLLFEIFPKLLSGSSSQVCLLHPHHHPQVQE